jgi:ABC-type sugar transport system ATPase subunit
VAPVRFTEVSKRFGAVEAVRSLSLEVADGELMVLVGPSGSGKTTALRMLAGLEAITAGEIAIGGRVVNRVAPRERDVAMVFQDYALYPQMTVFDNLAFGLRRRGVAREEIRRRVQEAARALDIGALLTRKPAQLSGGQAQRVALGRALVREPQAFLMDEPLSNLDAQLRTQTRGEIRRLQQAVGTTTVYVTHDQVEAMTMGDRIAVLNAGVLEQVGTPEELYDHPRTRFVASFIGDTNLLSGRAVSAANGICEVETPAGRLRATARQPVTTGDTVTIAVRPERVSFASQGEGLGGVVTDVIFVGTARKYVVRLADGSECFVLRQVGQPAVGALGATVQISWQAEHASVFAG